MNLPDGLQVAEFSSDRLYRYTLVRDVNEDGVGICQFVGLNPSTADEVNNDPTVTRCCNFARDWGYRYMIMTNLFAFRATNPKDMKNEPSPIGLGNDYWLTEIARRSSIVVCAWGNHGYHMARSMTVTRNLREITDLYSLTITKKEQPGHPLFLKKDLKPILWRTRYATE